MRRNLTIILIVLFLCSTGAAFAQDAQDQAKDQQTQETRTPPEAAVQNPDQQVKPTETASTPSTARVIFNNFWGDQKDIWTSPFRMNRDNAKWWALFGVGTAALIATDRTAERALPTSVSQTSYSKDVSQIGQEYVTLPIAGALYLYGRHKNDPKAREVGVLGAEALLDSQITVMLLKALTGRERPNEGGNGRFFKAFGIDAGFPSGHAIETWSFASVISHEYAPRKIVPIVTYGLAT